MMIVVYHGVPELPTAWEGSGFEITDEGGLLVLKYDPEAGEDRVLVAFAAGTWAAVTHADAVNAGE